MFNLTRNDLARKTDAQLAALFNQASNGLMPCDRHRPVTQSLIAMIRAELARRGRAP